MQTKEQARNWKVVASVATVAALGVSGLAIASPGNSSGTPSPIELDDARPAAVTSQVPEREPAFQVVPSPTVDAGDSLDSPLASADPTGTAQSTEVDDSPSVADSPAATDSPTTSDSPAAADSTDVNDSPAPAPAPAPDDSAFDSGSVDSLDS